MNQNFSFTPPGLIGYSAAIFILLLFLKKENKRLVFGCVALSAMGTRVEVFRLLEAVVAGGVRHFDTARSYGRGFSEKLLGEKMRAHGEAFAVITKCGAS